MHHSYFYVQRFLKSFFLIVLIAIIGTKLCEDSRRYGSGNTCTSGNTLTRASLSFANARDQMEKARGTLLKTLGTQVSLETNRCTFLFFN